MEEIMSSSFRMNEPVGQESSHQIINYQNIDTNDVNANTAVLVDADNVTIVPSSGKHTVGSSKVKVRNVVDYSWEHKFYPGQILAIHISGTYIAYGIQGKESGNIRVTNFSTSERALIKGIGGMTQDIAFAFIMAPIILACIDSVGDVYVYTVEENQLRSLTCCLMLHIKQDENHPSSGISRIVWCPYVPDDDEPLEDDDPSKLIVTHGNKAHLWNVNIIRSQHGLAPVTPSSVSEGCLEIEIDNYNIVDLAFSPDGSTVALACSDGGIRFFQFESKLDVQEGQSPVCIHDWRPHDGKPVSCLYFLDNHLDSDSHFWKFAITGVEGNTELKIWTCETWSCLQTLKYAPMDDTSSTPLKLKVAVDITANYILISDMQRKLLHVLHLKKNPEETAMRVHIISEFLLSSPILSFGIVKTKQDCFSDQALSSFENSVNVFNDDTRNVKDMDEKSNTIKTMIKLYLVQPKALHECIIVYNSEETTLKYNQAKLSTTDAFIDAVESNTIMNGLNEKNEKYTLGEEVELLTPNDFDNVMDPVVLKSNEKFPIIEDRAIIQARHKPSSNDEFLSDMRMNNDVNRRSMERDTISHHIVSSGMNGSQETEEDCNVVDRHEDDIGVVVSTGSSPSREVQNIMFSEVGDGQCADIPAKNNEPNLPVTVWPKIPIPEPKSLSQDISDIMRISSADQVRMRNEANAENKKQTEYHSHSAELSAMYKKVEMLETRLNQLSDNISNQQQDMKQSFNVLHQCLLANKEEEKKKQRNANNDDRYLQDRLVSAISQNVNSMIGNEVEYLIKQEISGNVLPSLKNTMDTFGQQLQLKLTQHLTMADQQLKEYIIKTVHKKSVTDALANTLASVLPSVISSSFAEVFCNVILPKFEKSCHEMFDQVNNLFVEGTRDFVNVLQNHVRSYEEKQCSVMQNKMDEFIARLNEVTETASFNAVKNIEPTLLKTIKLAMEEQRQHIEVCIGNLHKMPTSNFFHTVPKPHENYEFLIAHGKIEDAIDQVLSASDLKLLVSLCEKLDPDKIFAEPCRIQQHVLLSFIQQLSADLNIHTDLKHKFIEGAVLSLDRKHPVCEKNIPRILPAVRGRIAQYIVANPTNKNTKNMKMLLMAVESLLSDKNEPF